MKSSQKLSLVLALIGIGASAQAQHSLKKIWETDTVLAVPESVLHTKTVLYTSLINGEPWVKDGKGSIGKVSLTGKIINANWITGLNAPKGMAIKGDILYVADMDELIAINISGNKIDHRIKVTGSENLNDVSIDSKGAIYITDSKQGNVYKVINNVSSLAYEGIRGANGVKAIGDKVYIAGNGLYVSEGGGKPTKLTDLPHGGDGIEPIGNGDFLVTEWAGYFYYVKADGTKQLLLDTHASPTYKTADIGYDPVTHTVYVPTFSAKSIVAYKLD
jgi:hypothetical protein